jgi:hypothetical protein
MDRPRQETFNSSAGVLMRTDRPAGSVCGLAEEVVLRRMNETMREFLNRRQRWNVTFLVIGLTLIFLPALVASLTDYRYLLHEHREAYSLVRIAGLLVLVGGSLVRARMKCPKCDKPLGAATKWSGVPAVCPNCGVNFNEPMPQNPISPIS